MESEFDHQQWLRDSLAVYTSHGEQAAGYVMDRLGGCALRDLQQMTQAASQGNVAAFDDELILACLRIQIIEEVKRRLEAMRDGSLSPDEAMNPRRGPAGEET